LPHHPSNASHWHAAAQADQFRRPLHTLLAPGHADQTIINRALTAAAHRGRDLRLLNDKRWLDDRIIDDYLKLAVKYYWENGVRVYAASVHFYGFLARLGVAGVSEVGYATKHQTHALLLFPVNVNDNHWILIVVNIPDRTIACYDSIATNNNKVHIDRILQYLQAKVVPPLLAGTASQGVGVTRGAPTPWKRTSPRDAPRQDNGYDCGVFVCASAAQLMRGEKPSMTGQARLYWQLMALELSQGRLREDLSKMLLSTGRGH